MILETSLTVISLGVGLALIRPFLSEQIPELVEFDSSTRQLTDHRERLLQVLRDLEFDLQTQKISSDDFERTKRSISVELAKVLKQLGEL